MSELKGAKMEGSKVPAEEINPELLRADELCSGLSGAVLYAAGTE